MKITQRFFMIMILTQVMALGTLLAVFERYTEGIAMTRPTMVATIVSLVVMFVNMVFAWAQQERINDLEYRQENIPELIQAGIEHSKLGELP